jgi:hypothetical protein
MNGEARLFVYGVTAEEWAAQHSIEVFSYPCSECGRMLTISRPFAQGTLRGLQAPRCECGNERTPFGLVRASAYGDLLTGSERRPASARDNARASNCRADPRA